MKRPMQQSRLNGNARRSVAVGGTCMLLLFAATSRGHDFGDDYGDVPASAYPVSLNTTNSGTIEIDIDQDWFSFVAAPLQKYTVTVALGTLWDSTLDVDAPDAMTLFAVTNSVLSAPARTSWIHFGPPATYYVGVGGFAEFTTGTYSIVVSQSGFTDLDHDGIDDDWEIAAFGSTNQPANGDFDHDGFSNIDEFLAGTSPTNSQSRLCIVGEAVNGQQTSVTCQVAPYRYYQLSVSTNLTSSTWQALGLVTNLQYSGNRVFIDTNSPVSSARYYRVGCVF